jgi:hypothetical protein
MSQAQEQFEADFDKFVSGGFLFTAKDEKNQWTMEEALRRLRFYTRLYIQKNNANISSVSAFRIVADALASDTDPAARIVAMARGEEQEEIVPDLTAEQYHALSARQVALRYRSDPEFKAGVERLISEGRI